MTHYLECVPPRINIIIVLDVVKHATDKRPLG
jgi:hypothetical protein